MVGRQGGPGALAGEQTWSLGQRGDGLRKARRGRGTRGDAAALQEGVGWDEGGGDRNGTR